MGFLPDGPTGSQPPFSESPKARVVKKLMHGFSWTVDPVCLRSRQDSTASSLIRRVLQAGKESIRVAPLRRSKRAGTSRSFFVLGILAKLGFLLPRNKILILSTKGKSRPIQTFLLSLTPTHEGEQNHPNSGSGPFRKAGQGGQTMPRIAVAFVAVLLLTCASVGLGGNTNY